MKEEGVIEALRRNITYHWPHEEGLVCSKALGGLIIKGSTDVCVLGEQKPVGLSFLLRERGMWEPGTLTVPLVIVLGKERGLCV